MRTLLPRLLQLLILVQDTACMVMHGHAYSAASAACVLCWCVRSVPRVFLQKLLRQLRRLVLLLQAQLLLLLPVLQAQLLLLLPLL